MRPTLGFALVSLLSACTSTHPRQPVVALPADPVAAYAALGNDCGVFTSSETPLATDIVQDHPFVVDSDLEGAASIHHGNRGGAPGWNPVYTASTWSVAHPAQSTESDLVGDAHLVATCGALNDLVFSFRSTDQPDGSKLRRATYLVHHLTQFPTPQTLDEALASGQKTWVPTAMSSELALVDFQSTQNRDGTHSARELDRKDVALRIACDKPLRLAEKWQTYSPDSFQGSQQSGTFCQAQSNGNQTCLVLAPEETLDGCTFVGESVAMTTDQGESVKFSFGGKLTRVSNGDEPYYELRVDKSRGE
jgi:hypothetical protein